MLHDEKRKVADIGFVAIFGAIVGATVGGTARWLDLMERGTLFEDAVIGGIVVPVVMLITPYLDMLREKRGVK